MTGYRTIIVNILVLLYAFANMFGVVVGTDEKTAISAGIIAVVGIILRFLTKTPVGKSQVDILT